MFRYSLYGTNIPLFKFKCHYLLIIITTIKLYSNGPKEASIEVTKNITDYKYKSVVAVTCKIKNTVAAVEYPLIPIHTKKIIKKRESNQISTSAAGFCAGEGSEGSVGRVVCGEGGAG